MTFGNDKLTNLFPPLITPVKNLKNTRKKIQNFNRNLSRRLRSDQERSCFDHLEGARGSDREVTAVDHGKSSINAVNGKLSR